MKNWDGLALRRQFWYLTGRLVHGRLERADAMKLENERNRVVRECMRRGIIRKGVPFPKAGCEDLIHAR